MRTLPSLLTAHIAGEVTTLAVCWRVERSDGVLILGTQHDQDITIAAESPAPTPDLSGTYLASAAITGSTVKSTADMAVDNLDVTGSTQSDITLVDLTATDIEAGLFDDASVTLFMVNWASPDDGQIILRTGTIGAITRTAEGMYKTELRGLTQRLTQTIIRTYGSSCDAELGDSRCGVDVAALTVTGTVTAVTNNRQFSASVSYGSPTPDAGYFNGGIVQWTSGGNESFSMEVKQDTVGSPPEIELFLAMPRDIQVGDTFTMRPGCDKSPAMCKGQYANLVNFRGHGAWVPGIGEMTTFGGQTTERKSRPASFLEWPRSTDIP